MPIDRAEVARIAELARLEFLEGELDDFTAQFQRILDHIEKLKEVDVVGVEPTSHAARGEGLAGSTLRADAARGSIPVAEALSNAPDPGNDHFRVPRMI
ncbi:MAG: Asp-tRNA(Asn)/Glu-tRNA(Gln) amidotransferase subunit GatC [Acidobacteria bacterium]|nr:Asp-tRNA(Asn)/Glu-tRNA(Gln) amidotransferase subunit GatC [Acidobacteriota bacterium]